MRKKWIKKLLAVILIFSMTISWDGVANAAGTMGTVSVKKVKQERMYWCWAASSVSVLYHYGKNITQSAFVTKVKGSVVDKSATISDVKNGLSKYSLSSTVYGSCLSFSSIKTEINNSRPIIVGILGSNNIGHMVALDGWDSSTGTQYIEYMDPSDGKFYSVKYSVFSSKWNECVYKIHK